MKKITLQWLGETYIIPEDRVFDAVDEMENYVTLASIATDAQALRMGRLSRAFSVLLEHAGAPDCGPEKVRGWMSASIKKMLQNAAETGSQPTQEQVQSVFFGAVVKELSDILMDGAPMEDEPEVPGKIGASSKKRSKSRSAN